MNEPWYIFGPKNAGGRTAQAAPVVPGAQQAQQAPVVNNVTYNVPAAPATDAGGALGGWSPDTSGLMGHPMNDPNYGLKPGTWAEQLFGQHAKTPWG